MFNLLIEKSLREYISATSSGRPTPGGGSVAALAGSLGSALTQMVGNLTFNKKSYEELDEKIQKKLDDNFDLLKLKMDNLSRIVDEDSKAFSCVMLAFKMPKDTEDEKQARTMAIQEGYKKALEVPLRCAEECLEVLRSQLVFAEYGNINAITDVGVGSLLAYAGLEGSLLNVRINLISIQDEEFKTQINKKMNSIMQEGSKLKEDIMKVVYRRLDK